MAIYYGDGSNSNSGRVIKVSYADSTPYGRTSISGTGGSGESNQIILWTALTHNKVSSTSHLRCQMHLTGHSKHSYPYYGTGVRADYSGGHYTTFHGSNYSIGSYISAGQVLWLIDYTFTPTNLANNTGNSVETIENDTNRDFFMDTEAALEYGIIDEVVQTQKNQ